MDRLASEAIDPAEKHRLDVAGLVEAELTDLGRAGYHVVVAAEAEVSQWPGGDAGI